MPSIRSDRPLEASTLATLRAVHDIASRRGMPYFVVGATARDILLTHVFGMPAGRATRDVDFAIAVEDWAQFEAIRQALAGTPGFRVDAKVPHRVYFHVPGGWESPIDFVPFGGVEQPPASIGWPPDMSVIMNVAGYREALAGAVYVTVADGLDVPVASIPGLALLKLFAWHDRGHDNDKDAHDLHFLMRHYADAGNHDRLYGDAFALLESVDHDPDLAGVCLLGQDVATLAAPATFARAMALLDNPLLRRRLESHMARASRRADALDHAQRDLALFRRGLNGAQAFS